MDHEGRTDRPTTPERLIGAGREAARGLAVRSRSASRRAVAAVIAVPGVVELLERLARTRPGQLTVLTYHRVDRPEREPDLDPSLLSATPEGFADQVAHLCRAFHLVSAQELLAVRAGDAALPPRSVMITFDDAYEDFETHAWPVLRRHGAPVTLFVPTAFPDSGGPGFWWDRLYRAFRHTSRVEPLPTSAGPLSLDDADQRRRSAVRLRDRLKAAGHAEAMDELATVLATLDVSEAASRVLGWERLRALAADGVTLAPHSRTHPLLNRLPADRMVDEVAGSLADIEREVGDTPPVFAYPAGGYSPGVVAALADAGFEIAFTTDRGTNDVRTCRWLEMARRNVGVRSGTRVLRAQLAVGDLRPRRTATA